MTPDTVFTDIARGIQTRMAQRDELPDDVPVADAVEQQRTSVEPAPDEEASAGASVEAPLEATPADWQEQLETVESDPEDDEFGR